MIKIYYKPSFVRQYKKLPKALQEEVKEKIGLCEKDPKHPFLKTHKLSGRLKEFYSFSVNYSDRIVFEYLSKQEAALLAVGDHSVYKD